MRLLPAILLASCFGLAGCGDGGDGGGDEKFPRSTAGVKSCLDETGRYDEVGPVDSTAGNVLGAKRDVINRAVRGSQGGLRAESGGPTEEGGTITEAPVIVSELYFFGDAAEAQRVAARLAAARGDAGEQAAYETRAVGPVVIVHYSYGPQDAPGGVPLNAEELSPVETCLRQTGYL